MVEKNAFTEKNGGWVVGLCWEKYAYIGKKGVGGQTVLEKICINGKNGWVGDFGVFADFFSICSAIFFLTPPCKKRKIWE